MAASTHGILRKGDYPTNMKHAVIARFFLGDCLQAQDPKALALKSRIELANVDGRIDHFSVDVKGWSPSAWN